MQPTPSAEDNKCSRGGDIMIVHLRVPLPADETRVPAEENNGLWSIPLKDFTVSSNIRRVNIARKRQATRRFERQRRGEVPTLALGFLDVSSNLYTGHRSSTGTKRSSASDVSIEAKRSRRSPSTSRSHSDDEELSDNDGFAAVGDSDDEWPNTYKLSDDMRENVQFFLKLQKAADKFQDYFDFEACDSRKKYLMYRTLRFDNPDVMAINTSYMPRGTCWL